MSASLYDPVLVALSVAIAILAAYTALELADRVGTAGIRARRFWIGGAALAMGGGIWSMHFIGMLAFRNPVPVTYDIPRTLLSLLVAIGATAAAFFWAERGRGGLPGLATGGLLLGLAIAGMHYIGMSAMRMPTEMSFDTGRVALSVLIAVVASTAGLFIAFRRTRTELRIAAAVVMGFAVAGMHYTGMWAAHFHPAASHATPATSTPTATGLGSESLVLWVLVATFVILFLALLAASVDQSRVQSQLLVSEERFRAAAEAVGDIIWTNDAEGRMTGEQPDWARFTGQSRSEYGGFGWTSAVHPDDVASTLVAWHDAVARRGLFIHEHRLRRHDGVWRQCAIRGAPVQDETGALREWVGVHEDITERSRAEAEILAAKEAAEVANLAKSQFIANMSHELRTPLSAIIGYSEMLQEDIGDSGDPHGVLDDMGKIQSNARHLLGLINDVLDLSKIESGRMEVFAEDFDSATLLQEVLATARSLVEKRGNTLVVDTPDLGILHTDLTKLRQILLNLLSNAAKFTENGTVTLHGARIGQEVEFSVTDTGIGISSEHLARLFERFQQADASTTRRYGGTGLGLSITKALCTMLGGRIDVRSATGVGSTFTLRLPARWHHAPAASSGPTLKEPTPPEHPTPEPVPALARLDQR